MLSREERALQFQSKSEIKFGKGFMKLRAIYEKDHKCKCNRIVGTG